MFLKKIYSSIFLQFLIVSLVSMAYGNALPDQTNQFDSKGNYTQFTNTPDNQEMNKIISNSKAKLLKDPNNYMGMLGLCSAYGMSKPQEALAYCERATKLSPRDPVAYFQTGVVYMRLGLSEEAVMQFKKGLSIDPTHPLSGLFHNNLCQSYAVLEDDEQAIQECKIAIILMPKSPLPYTNLGNIYFKSKSNDMAEEYYKRALYMDQNLPLVYTNLGAIYMAQLKLERAENCLKKALAIAPLDLLANYDFGVFFMIQKNYPQAIEHLNKTIQINPNFTPAHVQLSLAYCLSEDHEKALAEAEVIKQLKFDKAEQLIKLVEAHCKHREYLAPDLIALSDS
jgi:tetratricopeptide (TPR) repeat protein